MIKWTKNGEWAERKDGAIFVGISKSLAEDLGDVTFVALPSVGQSVSSSAAAATIEAVKAAIDFFSPVPGTVERINADLVRTPETLNLSPEVEGWLFAVKDEGQTEFDALLTTEDFVAWNQGQN